MDSVAIMPPKDRADIFVVASDKRKRISAAIMEKDFWVCWILKRIFSSDHFPYHLLFKGGTSLSKVFNSIERFSEDIDLSFDRRELGFDTVRDPEKAPSGKKQRALLDELRTDCEVLIRDTFVPALIADCQVLFGDMKKGSDPWKIVIDPKDQQTVLFHYPQSLSLEKITASAYIPQVIRLELGARSDSWPAAMHTITPYAAELFPKMFQAPSCKVNALEAERTFWEKATILHKEYHRPKDSTPGDRRARHYYDLYQLSKMVISNNALQQLDLLRRVVEHKKVFFRSSWAHYETALPGSFHLVPSPERLVSLHTDYTQMKDMIFGDYPEWDAIIQGLKELEIKINKL